MPGALRIATSVYNLSFLSALLVGVIGTHNPLHVFAFTLERQLNMQVDRELSISQQDN